MESARVAHRDELNRFGGSGCPFNDTVIETLCSEAKCMVVRPDRRQLCVVDPSVVAAGATFSHQRPFAEVRPLGVPGDRLGQRVGHALDAAAG